MVSFWGNALACGQHNNDNQNAIHRRSIQPSNRHGQRHCRHLHLAWVYRLFAPWRHLQPDRLRRDGNPVYGGEFDRPAIRVGLVLPEHARESRHRNGRLRSGSYLFGTHVVRTDGRLGGLGDGRAGCFGFRKHGAHFFLGARTMCQRQAGKTMAFTARQADIFAERPATVKA